MPALRSLPSSPPRPLREYSSESDSSNASHPPRPRFSWEQHQRALAVWDSYYAAVLHRVGYVPHAAFDDAKLKKMNLAGRDYILYWDHQPPSLVPIFVGNLYAASVHSNLVPLWYLVQYLTGGTSLAPLVLTLLGKGKTGATLWTDADTAELLLAHGNCRVQVAPSGFYVATDDEQQQVLLAADHGTAKPHAAGFPVRSMTFAPSEAGARTESVQQRPTRAVPVPVCAHQPSGSTHLC